MPANVRAPKPPPEGSPAVMYPTELKAGRLDIDELRVHHLAVARRFLEAHGGSLYTLDLFIGAAMARSYSLVDGFIFAFDSWNPIVAAPLLRMQIDSLVRLSYASRAPSAQEIAEYVLGGGEFRRLRDSDGKLLTDRRLLDHAAPHHDWVGDVYSATSGMVHFSPDHLRAAWRADEHETTGGTELRLAGSIPTRPDLIGVRPMQDLLAAMIRATEELFGYAEAWEARKGLPLGQMQSMASQTDRPRP